jgi:RHS repeat-associated protein
MKKGMILFVLLLVLSGSCLNAQTAPTLLSPSTGTTNAYLNQTFSWNPVSGVTYRIQISTSSYFGYNQIDVGGLTNTTYQASGLYMYTTYYWRVASVTTGGSTYSSAWQFTTGSSTQTGGGPTLSSPANNAINIQPTNTFSWNSYSGASSYRLQISTTSNFSVNQFDVTTSATSYQITGLSYSTGYYWRVGAVVSGNTVYSNSWQFTTGLPGGGGGNPGPTLLTPVSGATNVPTNSSFTWQSTQGSTYRIQISTSPYFGYNQIDVSGLTSPNYTASGLYLLTSYYWRVNSTSTSGTTDWSVTNNFTTSATNPPSGPPAPVLATPANNSTNVSLTPTLTWNSSQGATSYNLQVSTNNQFSSFVVNLTGLTATSDILPALTGATTYYWRASATNSNGTSSWSTVWNFSTISSVPQAPTLVSPLNNSTNVLSNSSLSWNIVQGALTYGLQVSTNNQFTNLIINQTGISATSYNQTVLNNGIQYFWRVNATNTAGTSAWSTVWNFTTSIPIPPIPTLLQPANNSLNTSGNLLLSWNQSSGAATYELQVSSDQQFTNLVYNQTGISNTSYNVTNLTKGIIYYWKVRAVNTSGASNWSVVWNFTTAALPVLVVTQPVDNYITNITSVTVSGSVNDNSVTVKVNGLLVNVAGDKSFITSVNLLQGNNAIIIVAKNVVGDSVSVIRNVKLDNISPVISITTPVDGFITNQSLVNISGTIQDATITSLMINGTSVTVNNGAFATNLNLLEGLNHFTIVATDEAGNSTSLQRTVRLDTQKPVVTLNYTITNIASNGDASVVVNGTYNDSTNVTITVNGEPVNYSSGHSFTKNLTLLSGQNTVTTVATDEAGNTETISTILNLTPVILPPDPVTVATPVDSTVVTSMADATEFLYTGVNPIQTGVTSGTIDKSIVAVIKGKVFSNDMQPLSGVEITIFNHPEFGKTLSRLDGKFDLAVNGGGYIILNYKKDGYLQIQRQIKTPWQNYAIVDSVVMLRLDPNVTGINLSDSIQVAKGSIISDDRGARQAVMLFRDNTQATVELPDGSTQLFNDFNVRATEYTVGVNGPLAMPAQLPSNVAYTYCVELSLDEAQSLNATNVVFNKPVSYYVDNYLDFPVGAHVPVGYYDRNKSSNWIPMDDGRIIKIVSIINNKAQIDINGDNIPEPLDSLLVIGIDSLEQRKLAALYPQGKVLWRVSLPHFCPLDLNLVYIFPDDSIPPNMDDPKTDDDQKNNDECKKYHSIIGLKNQSYGQAVPLTGTGVNLYYNSDRMPGRISEMNITLSDSSLPASVTRIYLKVEVAGKSFSYSFNPSKNLSYNFKWDKKDAYGRILYGLQSATVEIGYEYMARYVSITELIYSSRSFMQNGSYYSVSALYTPFTRWSSFNVQISAQEKYFIGGWTADVNHSYDPYTGLLIYGNGDRRSNALQDPLIKTILNVSDQNLAAITSDSKGNIYYSTGSQIIRLNKDNTTNVIAGTGVAGYSGDGGPAVAAQLDNVSSIVMDKQGVFIFADCNNNRIRKISLDGIILTIAGTGNQGFSGDGGLSINADITVSKIALSPDGSLFFTNSNRVRKITPDGMINTIAGSDVYDHTGDGGQAKDALFNDLEKIAVGNDGSIFVYENYGQRIRKINTDGIVTTIAGNGQYGSSDFINGSIATESNLSGFRDIYAGQNYEVYVLFFGQIGCITLDGIIKSIAGGGQGNSFLEDSPAGSLSLMDIPAMTLLPDNSIVYLEKESYITSIHPGNGGNISLSIKNNSTSTNISKVPESKISNSSTNKNNSPVINNSNTFKPSQTNKSKSITSLTSTLEEFTHGNRIRTIYYPFPLNRSTVGELNIVSEDGKEIYKFNEKGTHLKTIDAMNGKTIYDFKYNSAGLLTDIIDIDSLVTKINWVNNKPVSVVSPFNQVTQITTNSGGYIDKIINPANDTVKFEFTSSGLMTKMLDAKGNPTISIHDVDGKFIKEISADSGKTELIYTGIADGYQIESKSSLGSTKYIEEILKDKRRKFTIIGADGLATVSYKSQDGSTTTTYPDGTYSQIILGPDPRFGMQAPLVTKSDILTPGGTESISSMYRRVSQMTGEKVTGLVDSMVVNNKTYLSTYNGIQNTVTGLSPMGRTFVASLDTIGRLIQSSVPGIENVNYKYNRLGFLTETSQGTRKSTFTYDNRGRVHSITDPMNRTESFAYDSVGRVVKQVLLDLREIHYSYDANGNLTSITPPGRPAHTFDYTPVDLTNSYTPPAAPDTIHTRYEYNLDRQLTKIFRPDGTVINFTYGPSCGCSNSGKPIAISYDRGTLFYSYSSDKGQLSSIVTPSSDTLSYNYDGFFLTNVQWKGAVKGNLFMRYDENFRMFRQSINNYYDIYYSYDDDGLLTYAGNMQITHNPSNGLITGTSIGNITGEYSYNNYGEMNSYTAKFYGSDFYSSVYDQDSLGRIKSITETINGSTNKFDYGYNTYGYLTNVKKNDALISEYVYDSNGNRKSATINGVADTAAYDVQDRMVLYGNSNYVYTKNGDLRYKITGNDTTKYFYDSFSNLTGTILPDGTIIDYIIDGQNRRIGKKVNGSIVKRWIYKDQLNPVAEVDSLGNTVTLFVPGYMMKQDTTYAIITDHLGSVRFVVNTQDGTIAQQIDYDEFGNVVLNTNPDFQPFGFAGGLYDEQTKLTRFGARDYSAHEGRWTTKDPIGFSGGVSNLYEYVLNDPINIVDFYGLQGIALSQEEVLLIRVKELMNSLNDAYDVRQNIKENINDIKINVINIDNYKLNSINSNDITIIDSKLRMIEALNQYGWGMGYPKAASEFNDVLKYLNKYLEKKENRECYAKQKSEQNSKGFWRNIWDTLFK